VGRSRPRARRWSSAGAGEVNWYAAFFGPSPGEALLTTTGSGRGASFGPSGITYPKAQRALFEQVPKAVGQTGHNTLDAGELIRQSKAAALAKPI